MKTLFWALAALALAVALTLAARYGNGYVVLVFPPYRAELSLGLAIFLILAAFLLVHGLLRLAAGTLGIPARARAFRQERQKEKARADALSGMLAFAAGRHAEAETLAAAALEQGEEAEICALLAARSAHALGAPDRRDAYLGRIGKTRADYPDAGMGESA